MVTKKKTEQHKPDLKKAHEETDSSKAATGNAKVEFDLDREADELLQTLQGDLSEIEVDNALGLIDQWHSFLNKSKEADVKELADALKDLRKMLKGGKATGHEISERRQATDTKTR
jgi:hypothetical protein